MSESPPVPTKLVDAASPGILDLPDITMHAEGQPSAEGPLSDVIHGNLEAHPACRAVLCHTP